MVERGGAQPFGWLPCGFVVFVVVGVGCAVVVVGPTLRLVDLAFFVFFVAVGGRERQCVHDFSFSLD